MKFGTFRVAEAEGAVLAHALKLPDGRRLKKGSVLSRDDIEAIIEAGIDTVIAARLETDDTAENEAARRIADALVGPEIRAEAPATGRVNLYAVADGVFRAERQLVDAINSVDPGITLATLDHLRQVNAGRMVATVKIIPYAVPQAAVAGVVETAASRGAGSVIGIDRYEPRRIGVVATKLPSLKRSVMDKTIRVLEARLAASRSVISGEIRTGHDESAVAAAIGELLPASDIVLVFGASAICDPHDVIPAAIRRQGGRIVHFGMPVDPGNLMLLGEIGGKPVIGAPGCARSPAENGFDWILQRLIAGRKVTAGEITGMGVGGLLMEIGLRPQPREGERKAAKRIAAVILAAGRSTRMGKANKLLARLDGKPMIAQVADAAMASAVSEVIVVTGHQAEEIGAALGQRKVRMVHNDGYAGGLSTSLAAGIGAVSPEYDGAIILLGDMPHVTAAMVDRMIEAFADAAPDAIVMAVHGGERGNPVLWPRSYFEELTRQSGDKGGRDLIGEHGDRVVAVELGDAAAFDVDTPDELAAAGGEAPVEADPGGRSPA